MSQRVTQVILVCEDGQHEAFARRFLALLSVHPRSIRVLKAPKGRGSGEHWVRQTYAEQVKAFRSAPHIKGRALVFMVDEDTASTRDRQRVLEQAVDPPRSSDEAILHIIPARNIETWIAFLRGEEVDEQRSYPKLERERDCKAQVERLKSRCDAGALASGAPSSLQRACTEFRTRWAR